MKREATASPKFEGLALRLGLQRWETMGLLEAIWHFTAKVAPRGDIGRWTDDQIARSIGWDRTPGAVLIRALVEERWLDISSEHRLVVHDWGQHADDAINLRLARAGEYFADGQRPKVNRLSVKERERIEKLYRAHAKRTARAEKRTASAPPEPEPRQGQSQSLSQKPALKETLPAKKETAQRSSVEPRLQASPSPISETDTTAALGKIEPPGEGGVITPIVKTWNRVAARTPLEPIDPQELSATDSKALLDIARCGQTAKVVYAIEQLERQPWAWEIGPGGSRDHPRPVTLHWLISDPEHWASVARLDFEPRSSAHA